MGIESLWAEKANPFLDLWHDLKKRSPRYLFQTAFPKDQVINFVFHSELKSATPLSSAAKKYGNLK